MTLANMGLVFLGGGMGACLRWLFGLACAGSRLGVVGVNLLGCLLVGVAAGYFARNASVSDATRLLVITGLLGGFTTFSAFSLEALALLNSRPFHGALYVAAQVAGGLLLAHFGQRLVA